MAWDPERAAPARALLILGAAGAGKSTLALDLMAFGARLIADDVVALRVASGRLHASHPRPPARDQALIEARGIGVLTVPAAPETAVSLVIDLDQTEDARLPERRTWRRFGVETPLLRRPEPLFPAAILAALRFNGPRDPDLPV